MKREQKYKDTQYFHFYNANPKDHYVGDCVIRAISGATGKSWDEVYDNMCKLGKKYKCMPNDDKVIKKYLESIGYVKQKEPRNRENKKYKTHEFLKEFRLAKVTDNMIANVGSHHMVAIVKRKVNDIWDSSYQTLHSYWVPKV